MTDNTREDDEKRAHKSASVYLPHFQEDLSAWFTIDERHRGRWHGCRFISHMDGRFNENRHWAVRRNGAVFHSTEEIYMFSAAVCMIVLLMQTVAKLKGEKAAYALMASKDWPICSCGMGGWFVHPLQMLKEANLLPEEGTSAGYRKMFLMTLWHCGR